MGRRGRDRGPGVALVFTAACALVALVSDLGAAALAADACLPAAGDATARLVAIEADLDVRLDDGRIVRLAGLDVRPAEAAAARAALRAWAGDGPIAVHPLAASPDRWGRVPALLFEPGANAPSAAARLLDAGLARAKPEAGTHPCFAAWLDAEDRARAAKRGLWADPRAGVIEADDGDGLARASGGFAIVEGTLAVHAARGGTLYLTLGRDRWGFAGVLTRRDAARLAKGGFDVEDYAGAPVRLRGDLDDRFGARIRLDDPDQLDSLEPGALGAVPAGAARTGPRGDEPAGVARPH